MNKQFDDLMYSAGLTAQGCWDQMDEYNRDAILKFAELIVQECLNIVEPDEDSGDEWCVTLKGTAQEIKEHFGVEE